MRYLIEISPEKRVTGNWESEQLPHSDNPTADGTVGTTAFWLQWPDGTVRSLTPTSCTF